ncbi:hypothetical protein F5050DRAFT_1812091 [Lentinula boryana]|uniref:DUF6593 domain-containing protein n=1 Tax=Lentinula boryana TaxID=40481 RepID=A0ABQ8Q0D2_9AGAR|nr:hypothetical protein F5050DRAFT_1812091 [Lentinula boryana]
MAASPDDIMSWTNQDPRESQLFNSWGILYRFQTTVSANGTSVTTLYRTIRANKEDRVAKLEWASNGGLGRVVIGKNTLPMSDLVRPDPHIYVSPSSWSILPATSMLSHPKGSRIFNGPDGLTYRWRPGSNGDILLQDANGNVLAFYRTTRQTRYQIGDVFGELHFIRSAGSGTVMHPPIMDMVTVTAMLYRFCALFNL